MSRLLKISYTIFLILISLSGCSGTHTPARGQRPWTHIELGAGNYGKEGHTKIALRKTVLKEFTYVGKTRNFIDELPEFDKVAYDPNHQYAVLFSTLDKLIEKKGPRGVFHINDLYPEYANYAVEVLRDYARKNGYSQIIIEAIPGDYLAIDSQQTLAPYHLAVYDSVHLKNPEVSFFNYGMEGNKMLSNETSRQKGRSKLQTLANLSYKGLYFFPIEPADYFIPTAERESFIQKGVFYRATKEWAPVAYYFPEGQKIDEIHGHVYFIKSKHPDSFKHEL